MRQYVGSLDLLPVFRQHLLFRDPHSQRTVFEKSTANGLGLFRTIYGKPGFDEVFPDRPADRQGPHRFLIPVRPVKAFLLIRTADVLFFPCDGAQYAVDESAQAGKSFLRRQFDGFADRCPVRYAVHIQDLVYRHPQDLTDARPHFRGPGFGILIDDVIQLQPVLQCSFHQPEKERPVRTVFHFLQIPANHKMALHAIACYGKQSLVSLFSYEFL